MTIDRIGPLRKILSSGNEMKIKNTGKTASDIRKELTPQRIKELRDKLEDPDQYLTKEVAEKIAEKVAESFGIK
jgi:hypothetical protein